jgi:hypothetical protein
MAVDDDVLDASACADNNGVALVDKPCGAEEEAYLGDKLLDRLLLLSVTLCCHMAEEASASWHTCDEAEVGIGVAPCYFHKKSQKGPCCLVCS